MNERENFRLFKDENNGLIMKILKTHYEYFLAPFFVLCIMSYVFVGFDLFPFGESTLSWGDMSQQNLPVLAQFKDILEGKQPLLFSMVNAGGMDFLGMFLFLASSPFSLLALFINKIDLVLFINIMILMKLMTCSITAIVFFKSFFKNLGKMQIIALAISYALCGYSMMFYQLHTWLDVMYMFPLLLVAFKKLITEDKIAPYVVSLSLMILFQFYLGYMLAVFIVIAFGIHIIIVADKENRKKNVVYFAIGTVISALITAVVWMTGLNQYLSSARNVDLIESLSSGNITSKLNTTLGFLFATVIILIAIPFSFSTEMFKNKKSRGVMIVFGLMLIPIIIEPINKMWHTGSYQAFPVRYGYITILVGLALVALIMTKINNKNIDIKKSNRIAILVSCLSIILFYVFIKRFLTNSIDDLDAYVSTFWGNDRSILMILCYLFIAYSVFLIIFLLYKHQQLTNRTFSLLLCYLIIIEGIFNGSVYYGFAAHSVDKYQQAIELSETIDDDSVYRVKVAKKYFDVNLVGAMGYNSLAHYTSLINEDYMFAMKKLGYSSYWMEVNSNGSTAFVDAFLGNKYTIMHNFNLKGNEKVISSIQTYSIVENEFNMSLGTVISDEQAKTLKSIPSDNRINFQNKLYKALTGSKEDFIKFYDVTNSYDAFISNVENTTSLTTTDSLNSRLSYTIKIDERENLYFDCFKDITGNLSEPIYNSFDIRVNGILIEDKYPNQSTNGMLDLGEFENEIVDVNITILKSIDSNSLGVFGIELDDISSAISEIQPAEVEIDGDKIIAKANAQDDNQMLILTIPYNEGFTAKVNGKEVEVEKILDAFMAIPLEKGDNVITLSYIPKGFVLGIGITLFGIILLVVLSILLKKGFYKKIKLFEKPVFYFFVLCSGLVFIVIYIFPVVVYVINVN